MAAFLSMPRLRTCGLSNKMTISWWYLAFYYRSFISWTCMADSGSVVKARDTAEEVACHKTNEHLVALLALRYG
jgi:hypothetical protein